MQKIVGVSGLTPEGTVPSIWYTAGGMERGALLIACFRVHTFQEGLERLSQG